MQCLHGWGQRGAMELLVREQVGGQPCSLVVLIARYMGWRLQEALSLHTILDCSLMAVLS